MIVRLRPLVPIMGLIGLAAISCSHNPKIPHLGERKLVDSNLQVDSIIIPADTTSLRGNFVMMDSSLMYVDNMYCKIYEFNIKNGELSKTYSGYGQGPNEMINIMYGSVVHPTDTSMWIFDASSGFYEFSPKSGTVEYKGKVDFSWYSGITNDYTSPSCYKLIEVSDFGVSVNQISDSVILVPVSLINRRLNSIEPARYKQGRIFGEINPKTYVITGLEGCFPESFTENPTPAFEYFDYAVDYPNSRLFVTFAPDPLIYCYDFNGNILNTFGIEPDGVDRDYTVGYVKSIPDTFYEDIKHVGTNKGIFYDESTGLIIRSSERNMSTGESIIQVYKDYDLVLEKKMPDFFQLLGKFGSDYYGVRRRPVENDNDAKFILYKFSLDI